MSIADTVGRVQDVAAMEQAEDIKASEEVGIFGLLREKKYIKSKHLKSLGHHRLLPFTEPYQVAAHKLNLSWTRTNKAVMVQTAGCALDCSYCYVGDEVVVEATTQELYEDYWRNYCLKAENPSPIFRISGGEPFLQQNFVADLVRLMRYKRPPYGLVGDSGLYVWVNTNLTHEPGEKLLNSLHGERVGVVGSWKPVSAPEKFDTQLSVASRMLDAGVDLYFYWPCALDEEDKELLLNGEWDASWVDICLRWSADFLSHLHTATRHLGDYYAARLQPTTIQYHYGAVGGLEVFSTASAIKRDFMLRLLEKFIRTEIGEEYWWLADYMIDVRTGVLCG